MTSEHLPLLVELDAGADVLRYILGRARNAREVHEFWEPICADTDADAVGLGWWIGWRRSNGDFLGWWNLSPDRPVSTDPVHAEAGWRLVRQHWRQGFATEGATKVLDHGFGTVGLGTVWAETMAVNQPSRQVMAKLGMRHVRTDHRQWDDPLPGTGQGEVVYEVTREEWTHTPADRSRSCDRSEPSSPVGTARGRHLEGLPGDHVVAVVPGRVRGCAV